MRVIVEETIRYVVELPDGTEDPEETATDAIVNCEDRDTEYFDSVPHRSAWIEEVSS